MILTGRAPRERKLAVASGSAGLEPHVRVELLAVLAKDDDQLVAERASSALLSQPIEVFLSAVRLNDAARPLLEYAAENYAGQGGMADMLGSNPSCPLDILARVAGHFSPATIQSLLEDLDRLTASPSLVQELASSSALTPEQKKVVEELQGETDAAALSTVIADVEPDLQKRQTLLQRLGGMRVIERVQLALKGNRDERMALIRDPNKMVQRAVLQSPRITDQEIENFAAMANLSEEVLRLIAVNRSFIKNYVVARNLINNPKTPLDITLHLLARLNAQDLKNLTMNKNVPETLRSTAMKLQRQRKAGAERR